MNEWSVPQSHRVRTTLRSTPAGRGGAGGTSPFAMRSVQPANARSGRFLPWFCSTAYIALPRTPVPSRHSHASACVFSSGLALRMWSTLRVSRLPS